MSVSEASAVNGQSAITPADAARTRRLKATDLRPVIIGKVYTFLEVDDVVAGRKTCQAFFRSYRLWERQMGTLDVQRRERYERRNADFGRGKQLDPESVEEMQKAARAMQRLELRSYGLPQLEVFFRSPRKEQDTVRLFDAHSLEVNLSFSHSIARRGQVDALIERIRFHCSEVTHLLIDAVADSPCRAFLAGLPALTSLDLRSATLNDWSTIPTLCPKLQRLSIDTEWVWDALMEQAATIFTLWQLNIGMNVTDVGLTALARHPSLRAIKMIGCEKVTNAGIKELATIPNLQSFRFGNCKQVNDLSPITSMKSLRSLFLQALYWRTFPEVLRSLRGSQLEVLEVTYCDHFDDSCLQEIGTMSKLRHLTFKSPLGGLLTDKGLGPLAGCHDLRSLTIDTRDDNGKQGERASLWQFTTGGLTALVTQLPQFCELNVRNCGIETVDADEIEKAFYKSRPNFRVVKPTKAEKKEDGKVKP